MASAEEENNKAIDALALIERASVLMREASPVELERAANVVINKGQYETMKFLLNNSELEVDKCFLLHRALAAQKEDIAKLLVESGADVNVFTLGDTMNILMPFYDDYDEGYDKLITIASYLPLQLSLFCSLDVTRFLLKSSADVNKQNRYHETALIFACCMFVGENCVDFLSDIVANDHVKDWVEKRAHHFVTHVTETVTLLIDHGAHVNEDYYNTSLASVCSNLEAIKCLKLLLKKRAKYYAKIRGVEIALHEAARTGNSVALQLLIQFGAQLEARSDDGDTALILACEESVPAECVRILLENGAFPNVQNRDRKTPLNMTKEARNEEKIQMLLRYGATEENRIDQGETDLMLACRKPGNTRSVLRLLQNNASPNVKNQRGETAVHIAAGKGDIETLKLLVQYKADVNAMTDDGETPLMLACARSSVNLKCVKFLLKKKALPNLTDAKERPTSYSIWYPLDRKTERDRIRKGNDVTGVTGNTTFHRAVLAGNIDKMKALVQHEADVNARNGNDETALMYACAEKSVDVKCVKFLLEHRAWPNMKSNDSTTALHCAIEAQDIEKLKILIQHGADVNEIYKYETTPVMLACGKKYSLQCLACLDSSLYDSVRKCPYDFYRLKAETKDDWRVRTEIVKLLVKHGADLEARTSFNQTLFLDAAQRKDHQLVELLYDLGADVSAEDGLGRNLIMSELDHGLRKYENEMLQYWIDKGVPVNHTDKNGWTPLMWVLVYENYEALECLIKAGADVHAVSTIETWRGKRQVTALSFWGDYGARDSIAEKLIRLKPDAVNSLPERCNAFLHKMICECNKRMFDLLVSHGMAPTMSDVPELIPEIGPGRMSPLAVVLNLKCGCLVQYLFSNLILCPCDIYGRLYFSQWRPKLISEKKTDVVTLMDEFYSQPKSLFQLSFVTVSHALGGVPGRVDRVNSLPLPPKFKDKLLFKGLDPIK